MLLEHRHSALPLLLHLHSRLNTWLQRIGQKQLQGETRITDPNVVICWKCAALVIWFSTWFCFVSVFFCTDFDGSLLIHVNSINIYFRIYYLPLPQEQPHHLPNHWKPKIVMMPTYSHLCHPWWQSWNHKNSQFPLMSLKRSPWYVKDVNKPDLVQIMAWPRTGDKPLSGLIMT